METLAKATVPVVAVAVVVGPKGASRQPYSHTYPRSAPRLTTQILRTIRLVPVAVAVAVARAAKTERGASVAKAEEVSSVCSPTAMVSMVLFKIADIFLATEVWEAMEVLVE
jgi:hypothetical protein